MKNKNGNWVYKLILFEQFYSFIFFSGRSIVLNAFFRLFAFPSSNFSNVTVYTVMVTAYTVTVTTYIVMVIVYTVTTFIVLFSFPNLNFLLPPTSIFSVLLFFSIFSPPSLLTLLLFFLHKNYTLLEIASRSNALSNSLCYLLKIQCRFKVQRLNDSFLAIKINISKKDKINPT